MRREYEHQEAELSVKGGVDVGKTQEANTHTRMYIYIYIYADTQPSLKMDPRGRLGPNLLYPRYKSQIYTCGYLSYAFIHVMASVVCVFQRLDTFCVSCCVSCVWVWHILYPISKYSRPCMRIINHKKHCAWYDLRILYRKKIYAWYDVRIL